MEFFAAFNLDFPAPRRRFAWRQLGIGLGLPLALVAARAQDAGPTLAPLVVTGTRTEKALDDAPIRTEVVPREEIERTHARTLKQALENVPGLQLREILGKSGYEVSLQGLTSDQVLVLIDGLPITASTGSTVDLSQYLVGEVERIEVVKGATSAQYGSSAMGGVINVITRGIRPGFAGAASVDAGSYGSQNVSGGQAHPANRHGQVRLEGGNEAWRLRVAADGLKDDGFKADPDAFAQQGDTMQRTQLAGRLAWVPSQDGEFWIDASTYREKDLQRYEYYAPPNFVPQLKTEDITRDRLAAGGRWVFANRWRAEVKAVDESYDTVSQGFSADTLATDRNATQRTRHVTGQVDLPAWHNQLWQFGADYHEERLDQSVNGASELDGGSGNASRSSRELFAQNDILFDDVWELVLGLRAQDDSDFGTHFAPKVALKANVLRGADWTGTLRAAFGQGYRVPNLKERHYLFDHSALGYMVIGNPNLKPEQSDSFQLGGTLALRDRVSLDVNAFYNRIEDLIQTDLANAATVNGITLYSYENVARARTCGVETALRWRATPALSFNAAYTFTRTRDLETGSELTRRPRDMARLGLDWTPVPDTTFSVRTRYQSDELVSTDTGGRSPAWTTVDVVLNQKLGRGFTAFAGINNVGNRQRDFADANDFGPLAGRFVYVGLSYSFDRAR